MGDALFVVGEDEVRCDPYPVLGPMLALPAVTWARPTVSAHVTATPKQGHLLVLRGPGRQARTYPVAALDVPAEQVVEVLGRTPGR